MEWTHLYLQHCYNQHYQSHITITTSLLLLLLLLHDQIIKSCLRVVVWFAWQFICIESEKWGFSWLFSYIYVFVCICLQYVRNCVRRYVNFWENSPSDSNYDSLWHKQYEICEGNIMKILSMVTINFIIIIIKSGSTDNSNSDCNIYSHLLTSTHFSNDYWINKYC